MRHIVAKKVLIFSVTDEKGGAENLLKLFALHCLKQGYRVDVVVLHKEFSPFWLEDGFYVTHIRLFIFKQIFNRSEYDISFSSAVYTNSLIGILSKLGILDIREKYGRESTRIFSRYSGWKLFVYRLFYIGGYRFLDTLICQNEIMKTELEKNLSVEKRPHLIQVINNPLNIKLIKQMSNEIACDDEIQNSFVSVGRLIPEKGFDNLIKAYALNAGILPNLYIFGEGSERGFLEKLIFDLGLGNKVKLPGKIDNPFPVFKLAHGCIMSSRIEGFPNVLNEMILLNDRVLSSYCVPEVHLMDFILKDSIFNLVDFSSKLVDLITFDNSSQKEAKRVYLNSLEPSVFFNKFFQKM